MWSNEGVPCWCGRTVRHSASMGRQTLCAAVAVAGAIGMILELEQGFGALVHFSSQPMRQAVNTLQTEREAELYEYS